MTTKLLPVLLFSLTTSVFADNFTVSAGEFVNNADGTITHTPTGLIWQACAVGQTWNGAFCAGDAVEYHHGDAMKLNSDFAGKKDWRVPTLNELNVIVDIKKNNPAINKTLFSNSPSSFFWSSSTSTGDENENWFVNFNDGSSGHGWYGQSYFVRLVRGGSIVSIALNTPTTDFLDNQDGTITHTKTGLTWQRCAIGQSFIDGGCDGKATTFTQEDKAIALTSDAAGKNDWRLPNYKELRTIIEYQTSKPAINPLVFPDTPSESFWSSSVFIGDEAKGWFINFTDGTGTYTSKTVLGAARLVRGTLSTTGTPPTTPTGKVDLTATLNANPSPAKINQSLTYSATITNKGNANATGTTLTFYVAPKFMSYVSASNGCELKNNGLSVVCTIGDLAAGANVTKTMNVIMQKSGGVSSSVFVKSNETDANPADNIGRAATGVKK